MKYLVISLLSVSLLFATVYDGSNENFDNDIETAPITGSSELLDNPNGTDCVEASGLIIESFSDEAPFPYAYSSPIERAILHEDEGPSTWPEIDWWDDITVYPGEVGGGQDFDVDEITGDLYAIFDTDHATQDSVIVYRSTDGGGTWSFWRATFNSGGTMSNPRIRVAMDSGGQTWVCMMYSFSSGLYVRRMTPDQSLSYYEMVTGNAVSHADMDADVGSGAYVYATWVPNGTHDVYAARNVLSGSGWVNTVSLYTNTQVTSYPAIAAGADGTVAVVFVDDRQSTLPQVRIKRSTNYGVNWSVSVQVSASGAPAMYHPDIAFTHGTTQTGWIIATYAFTSSDNLGFFTSTNSGGSWNFEEMFPTGDEENLGSIRALKGTVMGGVTVSYNVDPGDSVMFTWASITDPADFSDPVRINEFVGTSNWPSCAGWKMQGSGNYSAILYTTYAGGSYALMYDWWNHYVGIEGTSPGLDMLQNFPNPFSASTNISFSLTQNSPVTISIYNVVGQLVSTLAENQSFEAGTHSVQWNAQSFTPGVYFCRLNADGISQTHRMLMVR